MLILLPLREDWAGDDGTGCSLAAGSVLSWSWLVSRGVVGSNSSWVVGVWVESGISGPSNSSGACSSWGTGSYSSVALSGGFANFLKYEL